MRAIRLTRANGVNERVRGDANALLVVSDEDAAEMVLQEMAVYAPEHDPVSFVGPEAAAQRLEQLKATVAEHAPDPEPTRVVVDQDALAAGYPLDIDPELTAGERQELYQELDAPVPAKRPYGNASKAAWIDWAVHSGADPAEAAGLTKNELMARYGERL